MLMSLGLSSLLLGAQPFSSGKHAIAYKIDKANNTMTVISETAYDPKKDEGTSVHTLHLKKTTRYEKKLVVPAESIKPGRWTRWKR